MTSTTNESKRPWNRWTLEEDALLHSMSGDLPWPMVIANMHKMAAKNRWPRRTAIAIRNRARELGLPRACYGAWLPYCTVADELKMDDRTLREWIDRGRLGCKKVGRSRWVSRAMLRSFARKEPQVFAGLSEAQLFQLLDSEQLAAEIIAMKLPQKRLRKPVICVETGWWYPSITAAAKSVYVTQSTVRRAIVNGKTAGGRHWRFA